MKLFELAKSMKNDGPPTRQGCFVAHALGTLLHFFLVVTSQRKSSILRDVTYLWMYKAIAPIIINKHLNH